MIMSLFLFSACKGQNKTINFEWKEFVSEEGGFKATFPFNPVKSIKETDGGNRKIQSVRFEISLAEPEIYLGVMYADFPNVPEMNEEVFRTYYDNIRNGFKIAKDTELISERDVRVNGKLGRELTLKGGNQITKYRTYLIGNRQFQVITSTTSNLMNTASIEKDVNKFLDSFQLLEK